MSVIANNDPETGSKFGRALPLYFLIAVSYVLFGKLGLTLAQSPGYASPIFLPAGIAVAAALIGGRRTLPSILLGSLVLNVWVGYLANQHVDGMDFVAALVVALASVLQSAIGGWALRRVIGYPMPLDRSREILGFLVLTPLICLTSASLSVSGLLAIGVLSAASLWSNWAAWWGGDTLGVLVMLPLSMMAFGRPRALWRRRVWTVAVPMLLVFAVVVVAFLRASRWEYSDSLNEFRQLSQQTVDKVEAKLEEQESLLEQTAGLFASQKNGRVTREQFHLFVEKSLYRFPMIQAIEWAPQVDSAHRAAFEAAQRKEHANFEIREMSEAGSLQPAGARRSFYPVTYVEPLSGNEPVLGLDIASDPGSREALSKGMQTGTITLSAPVPLVQGTPGRPGVLLLLAVNRQDAKLGVVLTVMQAGDFMDKLVQNTRPLLFTRLVDLDEGNTLYDNFAPGERQALFTQTLGFGLRRYRVETAPTPGYLEQHRAWQSWGVLAGGILGTGLMGSLLLLGTGYTARIEMEVKDRTRELMESEAGLKVAQHVGRIGSLDWDAVSDTATFSEETCSILGVHPGKPAPNYRNYLQFYAAGSGARLDAAVKKAMHGGAEAVELDLELAESGGPGRWVTVRSHVRRDASGKFIGLSGTIQDITERKRIEEALRRSLEEIEDLYEHAPCGYHSLDENGLVVRMNHTELEWLGYRREEVVGRMRIFDLFTPPGEQTFRENYPRLIETGYLHDLEFEMKRKDGTVLPVLANATAIRDADGRFVSSRSTLFDITERRKLERELERQARIDMLTGLNNRRHFFELSEPQLARSRRHGEALSLLMMDLDNFKLVNDTYGHHIGDAALRKLSEVCRHTFREIDIIGRLGGEEFAALLPETGGGEAMEVAERVRRSVENAAVTLDTGALLHFTVSIGVSSFEGTDAKVDTMLKRADAALYQAKNGGRNRVCRA